jgi:glycosyltransferase involved in cell wall biosynthesis
LLVDFNNTEAAAGKILELMNLTPEQYLNLAERLKIRAKMFSWDSAIKTLELVYRDCL